MAISALHIVVSRCIQAAEKCRDRVVTRLPQPTSDVSGSHSSIKVWAISEPVVIYILAPVRVKRSDPFT